MDTQKDLYITQSEAIRRLEVTRSTLYYYMKVLNIRKEKFPLDRHVYLLQSDFVRILGFKHGAKERSESIAPL